VLSYEGRPITSETELDSAIATATQMQGTITVMRGGDELSFSLISVPYENYGDPRQ